MILTVIWTWILTLWNGLEWLGATMWTTYADFFSMNTVNDMLSNPIQNGSTILLLAVLEGLLSADNAIVLGLIVSVLPKHLQKKALFYGMAGAVIFRLIAVGLGTTLVQLSWVKFIGGAYLLWIAVKHFFLVDTNKDGTPDELQKGFIAKLSAKIVGTVGIFWATVIQVEMVDVAFSIDSVLAAFGVSDKAWVIFIGGIMGVFMMRGVAKLFIALLEKIPEFETTAYLLVAIIGGKMLGSLWGLHISHLLFFTVIIGVFLATFVVHHFKKKKEVMNV